MTAKSHQDIEGSEYDWLCSDANGHVALFSTAGAGYAPPEFLADTEAHDFAIATILSQAASGEAISFPEVGPGSVNTWKAAAERGLFAFDGDPNGGPYRLVAVPSRPTCVAELPSAAAAVVKAVVFPQLLFSERSVLSRADLERK